MALATNPALATEVTLQPLARFPLDAAILFSDILTIPDAMGLGLSFAEGEGPRFAHPARDEIRDPLHWRVPDMQQARVRVRCGRADQARARRARAADRIRGQSVHAGVLHDRRRRERGLCDRAQDGSTAAPICSRTSSALNARAVDRVSQRADRRGVDAVMLFDTWGGLLSAVRVSASSRWRRCATCLASCTVAATVGAFRRSSSPREAASGSTKSPRSAPMAWASTGRWTLRRRAPQSATRVALQGNLDPLVLLDRSCDRCARSRRHRARRRAAAGPHLQSRPRHRPRHAARQRGRAGRGRPYDFARNSAPLLDLRGVRASLGKMPGKPRQCSLFRGLDKSPPTTVPRGTYAHEGRERQAHRVGPAVVALRLPCTTH